MADGTGLEPVSPRIAAPGRITVFRNRHQCGQASHLIGQHKTWLSSSLVTLQALRLTLAGSWGTVSSVGLSPFHTAGCNAYRVWYRVRILTLYGITLLHIGSYRAIRTSGRENYRHTLTLVASTGFEPVTYRLSGDCSTY